MNILLVDDRPENLLALVAVLEPLGENLVTAASAADALRLAMQMDFAAILMDVQMPEMNGYEAAALLRKRKQTLNTPIIFITANDQGDEGISQGYSVGAVDYIFKPFSPSVLRAKVAAFVQLARNTQALKDEITLRQRAEEEVRRINRELEDRVTERTASIARLNTQLHNLLRETHHRVKNNLQLLTAMIDLLLMHDHATVDTNDVTRLASHVQALGLVHELISEEMGESADRAFVPIDTLLRRIVALMQQMRKGGGAVVVNSHLEHVFLPARESTSLALIVNELCSNAMRYGRGEVEISFDIADDVGTLQVCDDGPGFEKDFAGSELHDGLTLVEALARHDLSGSVQYSNREEGGARVTVSMPIMPQQLRSA